MSSTQLFHKLTMEYFIFLLQACPLYKFYTSWMSHLNFVICSRSNTRYLFLRSLLCNSSNCFLSNTFSCAFDYFVAKHLMFIKIIFVLISFFVFLHTYLKLYATTYLQPGCWASNEPISCFDPLCIATKLLDRR